MIPAGHEHTVVYNGQTVVEREYSYEPFAGLNIISAIYIDSSGTVVAAKVLSESGAGGSSTIGNE